MRFPLNFVKLTFVSWLFWGVLTLNAHWGKKLGKIGGFDVDGYASTAYYSLNMDNVLKSELMNVDILLLTAHPDDESMFFTPTLLELSKANYNNSLNLLCLSNGNADGIGKTREEELANAARLLNFDSVKIGDFNDDINSFWDQDEIINILHQHLQSISKSNRKLLILTFDKDGVSGHPNHISLYNAVKTYTTYKNKKVSGWALKSWPVAVKYSGFLLTNLEIMIELLGESGRSIINRQFELIGFTGPLVANANSITIHSNINGWFLSMATMTWAHYSQMVAFRWGWVTLSKYMNSNELVRI